MSLKDLSDKVSGGVVDNDTPSSEETNIKNAVKLESAIEGSAYFLYGCIFTYYRLKGYKSEAPDVIMRKLKSVPKFTNEEEKKEYLKNSSENLHKFLYWYFWDDKERNKEASKEG